MVIFRSGIMKLVWLLLVVLVVPTHQNQDKNETWVWGSGSAEEETKIENKVEIKIPEPKDVKQTEEVKKDIVVEIEDEPKEAGEDRQGRSRGSGSFSEQFNDQPIYRPASSVYKVQPSHEEIYTDTDVIDVSSAQYANQQLNNGKPSYGIVSDEKQYEGTSEQSYQDQHPGQILAEGEYDDAKEEGRFISLESIGNLFGLGNKKRPKHNQGRPPFGRPHQEHGPYGAPHRPHGRPPHRPHGGSQQRPHNNRPYKTPVFKRPPGFIPTDTSPHKAPYGQLPNHHGSNRPLNQHQDAYVPQKPAPYGSNRPTLNQHQDAYVPQQTSSYIPKPYPPKPSPTNQILDPYPKPNIQKPYIPKPSAAIIGPDYYQRPPTTDCTCVPEYLCKREHTVYYDGAGLIDERSKGDSSRTPSLAASPSTFNETLLEAVNGAVAEGRSLEVANDTISGRSADYVSDNGDVKIKVDVTIANREPRIVTIEKDNSRHIYPHGGRPQPKCQKPFVCCRKPVFIPGPGPGPIVPPVIHPNHGGIRPQEKLGQCGRTLNFGVHERVKNDDPYATASFGDYPWQVAILQQKEPHKSIYACGGVLVSPKHVLTVAHCIRKYWDPQHYQAKLKVRLGEFDVGTDAESYPYQEVYVAKVTIHPYFDPDLKNLHNDIAVIELSDYANVAAPHITPACLPNPNVDFYRRKCVVSGWGKNAFHGNYQSRLKHVEVPIVNHQECEHRLRRTKLGDYFKLHHGFICAGGERGKDACTGDGGSPLVCQDNYGSWQLVGLVSWGIGCGEQHVPGVYVNVAHYQEWLARLLRY